MGLGLLAVYLRWVLDPPPQVQPLDLLIGAHEDAQTVSLYMYALLVLTFALMIVARKHIMEMLTTFYAILFGQKRRR